MGTDIHPFVEVRRKGVWTQHRPKSLCPYYYEYDWDPTANVRVTRLDAAGNPIRSTWDTCKYRLPEVFSERHYVKFAVLGDVRNGFGFAGVPTHDAIPPMSSDRGVPTDLSRAGRSWAEGIDHSPGWLTLDEMKEYDFTRPLKRTGVIPEEDYALLRGTGKSPESWSGGINGPGITTLTSYEMDALLDLSAGAPAIAPKETRFYVQYNWTTTVREAAPEIENEIIPYLEKLVPKGGDESDVRLLFYFDS